jgi:hypothetical protein
VAEKLMLHGRIEKEKEKAILPIDRGEYEESSNLFPHKSE